jgi:hypothetical protein
LALPLLSVALGFRFSGEGTSRHLRCSKAEALLQSGKSTGGERGGMLLLPWFIVLGTGKSCWIE